MGRFLLIGIIHLVLQKFFLKKQHLLPTDMCTTSAYQGVRNVSFFGIFCVRTKWMIP